ncbi:MAG: UDP-N-acetylglucosamine diphosphorylase/glucosamine-1-phosphate N-acetyltransferase [Actinobacteria bacterium]|nr:MAG: UDP-N-acetylglucosamine diphosphorylase/glucosamine-1-phosphate N-acetyltransferase [Actinomycetota bacterium]
MIVLAAGQGKRMMSDLPKVAHTAVGRPLVGWVIKAVAPAAPDSMVVVLGHGAEVVRAHLDPAVRVAIQEEQLGTGHATQIGLDSLGPLEDDDTVVVLYGDMPLISSDLVERLAKRPDSTSALLVTSIFDDPSGYGRVIRDEGDVVGVVEDRDCTPDQLEINEINAGVYSFRAADLKRGLAGIDRDNAQGELYLTDVIGILARKDAKLEAVNAAPHEVIGINSQDQLADARKQLQMKTNVDLMKSGVKLIDPERTYIDDSVVVEPGATIYPGTHLEGETFVGAGSRIGPDVFAIDSKIGKDSIVWYSVLRYAEVGNECEVGPYASLRRGTVLQDGSKLGTFVETKNATLGEGAKANHLTYLGDATIGRGTNIGAGTITCNYDGYEKHPTVIGEDAFIGSDTMLVAPITIGDRAITGAGSALTKDVEADALAVERNEQKNISGYARRRAERQAAKKSEES